MFIYIKTDQGATIDHYRIDHFTINGGDVSAQIYRKPRQGFPTSKEKKNYNESHTVLLYSIFFFFGERGVVAHRIAWGYGNQIPVFGYFFKNMVKIDLSLFVFLENVAYYKANI